MSRARTSFPPRPLLTIGALVATAAWVAAATHRPRSPPSKGVLNALRLRPVADRSRAPSIPEMRARIASSDPVFVRWDRQRADELPELVYAVEEFDPGPRPAAQAAAEWLRIAALREPQESAPRLCVARGEVLGFYALANGAAELRSPHRKQMGVARATQPAVIVTWIAKSVRHDFPGDLLIEHAIGAAVRSSRESAATVLALDPFDEGTAEMWRGRYGFRNSAAPAPGSELPRMFLPLPG